MKNLKLLQGYLIQKLIPLGAEFDPFTGRGSTNATGRFRAPLNDGAKSSIVRYSTDATANDAGSYTASVSDEACFT